MVTVDQNLTITPTSIERDQPAFIFGPNYQLHRYSNQSEKANTFVGTYVGSAMDVEYPLVMDDEQVDLSHGYTKLTGDNVVVSLFAIDGHPTLPEDNASEAYRSVNGGYSKLLYAGKRYVGKKSELDDGLPIGLAVGDELLVSYTEGGTETSIKTAVAEVQYSDDGFDIDNEDSDSSSYEGGAGTLITIDDTLPDDIDKNSVSVVIVKTLNAVEFPSKNLSAGRGYLWTEDKITVDGKKVNGVRITDDLYVDISGYYDSTTSCKVVSADLYVTYRELNTSYSDTLHSVADASAVAELLDTVDPDNPLAQGVYTACLCAANDDGDEAPPVYFMAVPTDDLDGYKKVLNKITVTDRVYHITPTTRDEDVIDAVAEHVQSMSVKSVKRWRIGWVSKDAPKTIDRLDALMNDGEDYVAVPIADPSAVGEAGAEYTFLRVCKSKTDTSGNPDTRFRSTLVPGDTVRFNFHTDGWGEYKHNEYTIKRIVNNYTVELTEPVDVDTGVESNGDSFVPSKIEIYHTYTTAEYAEEIAKISRQLGSRRIYNVFPPTFEYNGVTMHGEFGACAAAGLVSATEPQQPVTNMTLRGIDNVPYTYMVYNNAELDVIASGGTFIIAQDLPNDRVYIRHQISTAYYEGNLNTAELSVTKNVDNISYAFDEVFRPYYGKYTITPDFIAILENVAGQLITRFGGSTSVYGPQLIARETFIRYIRQNTTLKDHVDVAIKLAVPYPCNNIDIVLTV